MKLLASAASAAIGAAALAPSQPMAGESAQFSVTVTGHVDPICNWVSGGADINLTLANFVDNDARVREHSRQLPLGRMGCNQAAYVSLMTLRGGMKSKEDASCAGGSNPYCVNYIATAEWNDASVTYLTDGTANAGVSSDISTSFASRQVHLTITPQKPPDNSPVVAGEFTDTLTVQVGPPM